MSLSEALAISESGLKAQRLVMELIASNIANLNSTRSLYGGPYLRKIAVLEEQPLSFAQVLDKSEKKLGLKGGGVEVREVVTDPTPPQRVYNPGHPDADPDGYVLLPNVSLSTEMVNMMEVTQQYNANITVFNATKKMMQDTLQLQ